MSHEVETMAYAGELPWHGLGVRVDSDLSAEEMMKAAGLDWTVERRDVFFKDDDGNSYLCDKKLALVRSHDQKFLDVVGKDWIPVQNKDAFEFFKEYVDAGNMEMHTAGSLKDGKIIWGLAKVEQSFDLFKGRDQVDSYLLLSNPHNYGRGVDIRFTPIRVVCNNTLTFSLNQKTSCGITLNHRQSFDAEMVKRSLEEASAILDTYQEMAEYLADRRYNQDKVFEYFNRVFPKTSNVVDFNEMMEKLRKGETEDLSSRNAALALDTLNNGNQPGAELGAGSWWSAYNTVTYLTNHRLGHNADTRLQSAWYGKNRMTNIDALGMAVEYAASSPKMKVTA